MQSLIRGLAAALLFVCFFLQTGCSRKEELYLQGIERENLMTEMLQETAAEQVHLAETELQTELQTGYVFVCGSVREPGVYQISEGMRVYEAVALAGGFSEQADQEWLNQAEYVNDGQKLYVYSLEETLQMQKDGMQPDGIQPDGQTGQKININTADKESLMTLPGIGEAKADAIIQYREENGDFSSIEEIQNIPGIKTAVFAKIKDNITV